MSSISSVSAVSTVSTHSLGMEVWRMSMIQKVSHDLRQRIAGKDQRHETPKVEPAAKVTISPDAKKMSQDLQ